MNPPFRAEAAVVSRFSGQACVAIAGRLFFVMIFNFEKQFLSSLLLLTLLLKIEEKFTKFEKIRMIGDSLP